MKCIAVDIGATSGRVMTVTYEKNVFSYEENKRFVNRIYEKDGILRWDFSLLLENIVSGIHAALEKHKGIKSIGIDTWAVDYGMLNKEGKLIEDPICYRDTHTFQSQKELQERIPFSEIYAITGIQDLHFNTIYQLYGRRKELEKADRILMIPDLIAYFLGGEKRIEYTNLSTTSLYDPRKQEISSKLLSLIGVDRKLFPEIIHPGESYGILSHDLFPELEEDIPILAVATHDTASAVLGTDGFGDFAYLSSGTWSLIGTELREPIITTESMKANFTNELGYDNTVRFLKNTMGMFMANELRKNFLDMEESIPVESIVPLVEESKDVDCFVNPDDPSFETPGDMIHKIDSYLERTGQERLSGKGEYLRVIYQSMAINYHLVLENLMRIGGRCFEKLIIVGGGNQAEILNRYAACATGIPVETGPIEATVLGNAMSQFIALGALADKEEGRMRIRDSITIKNYLPMDEETWKRKKRRFLERTGKGGI